MFQGTPQPAARFRRILGFIGWILWAGTAAGAFPTPVKVHGVTLEADAELPSWQWRSVLPFGPGDSVDLDDLNRAVRLLYAGGYCERIGVQIVPVQSSADIHFSCTVQPWIRRVKLKFSSGRHLASRKLHRALVDFVPGQPVIPAKIEEWKENLLKLYRDEGFPDARVDAEIVPDDPRKKSVRLVFSIREGKPQTIVTVEWEGGAPCYLLRREAEKWVRRGRRWTQANARQLQRRVQALRKAGYPLASLEFRDLLPGGRLRLRGRCGPRVVHVLTGWPEKPAPVVDWAQVFSGFRRWSDEPLQRLKDHLEQRLRRLGYPDGRVRIEVLPPVTEGLRRLKIAVNPGPPRRIGSWTVTGWPQEVPMPPPPIPGRTPWDPNGLENHRRAMVDRLHRFGYPEAVCATVVDETRTDRVAVRVNCRPGMRYRFHQVQFFGNLAWTDEMLRRIARIAPSSPYREDSVRLGEDRLRQWYWQHGYFKVRVESHVTRTESTGDVDVQYRILEGEQTHLGRIVFNGLRRTHAGFVRRWLKLRPGMPLRLDTLETFQESLYALGIFSRVDIPLPLPQHMETEEDLVIYFREARPLHFNYGLGYQERDHLRGIFTITHQNIAGKGYQAFGLLRFSFANRRALGSFGRPVLFSLPVEWRIALEYDFQDRVSFDSTRYRALFHALYRIARKRSLNAQLEISRTRVSDIRLLNPSELTQLARDFENLRLTTLMLGYIDDTRDSILDATRGHFLTVQSEVGLTAWGSDYNFIKITGSYSRYTTLAPFWTVAGIFRMGWARRLHANPLIPALSQRFYAGGSRSHRGFALDELGPRDPVSGAPTGGNSFWVFSLEQRFRAAGKWGLVGFLDLGNVFLENPSFRFSAFRKAAGLGLRYEAPVGLVGVDFAWLLDRRPGEKRFRWFITIGQEF